MQNAIDLAGNLSFLNLGDLIQLIGSAGSTGVLQIDSQYAPESGIIHFIKGDPINATNGALTGIDAIYALFGWTEGEYRFSRREVHTKKLIHEKRMGLILNGLRMLDDGLIEKLGPVAFERPLGAPGKASFRVPVVRGPLVDYLYIVDEESYAEGEEIAREGRHGSWVWVVLEGVVDIFKESSRGQKRIIRIGSGTFLGSISAVVFGSNIRSATTIAASPVQLGVLDVQRLHNEFGRMSKNFTDLVLSIENRLKQVTRRAVGVYLKTNKLDEFVKDRDLIIRQGSKSDRKLYTITRGEAYIVRSVDGEYVPLINLSRGDFFGTFPFLDMGYEPTGASVFGSKDLELSEIDNYSLKLEYDQLSTTIKNMIANVVNCLSATTLSACEFQKSIVGSIR